jgi:hypothetical protein
MGAKPRYCLYCANTRVNLKGDTTIPCKKCRPKGGK